ncbi:hypothetical protein CRUP_036550 [Coryphaenoides rupestris]|nr:hypothetical protein CRUP_036550 [Coryphaenoides rupestris]
MLENSEGIEKDYCDPKKTHSTADVEALCFDTMTRGLRTVRRLSSVSSVFSAHLPAHHRVAVVLGGRVRHLEPVRFTGGFNAGLGQNSNNHNTSISSAELEEKFQSDAKEVQFTAGQQTYMLNFQDFIQTNNQYGTKRLVRRRPRFVSSSEVQKIRTSKRPLNNHLIPQNWDKTQVPETRYKRVALQTSSSEYKEVEQLFRDTMAAFSIDKIERIQNKISGTDKNAEQALR